MFNRLLPRLLAPQRTPLQTLSLLRPPSFPLPPSFRSFSTPSTAPPTKKHAIGQIQRRLQITFTCTAPAPAPSLSADEVTTIETPTPKNGSEAEETCGHRSTHEFSKTAYEKGIVLVECPNCKNRHLIADNLSWFSSTPSPAHPDGLPIGTKGDKARRTVEDLMKEKGEEVKWLDGGKQGGTWVLE